ncbi:uncharacterized protein LOC132707508 [Cylas formicarius]|uniref:uncharacterized protein LOC132707508 n=1 Tax=Cylas formicarius TaxID=197179 RepID=UPI002958BBB7|nr:uncharacterized protein LOC132707508 [Cylas formicarius]XP_060535383.1 uncharacterized protein LOC132707508 [Cylas formicarius]
MKITHIFALVGLAVSAKAVDFHITNRDGGPIWVGIQGNAGHPHLRNGGFVLNQGETQTVGAPDNWAGRFWSRTWCFPDQNNHCFTGDCGNRLECAGAGGQPPATLIEIALKVYAGLDYYDVSLVDGYNSRASIEPIGGQGDGSQYSCRKAQCGSDINSKCPGELQVHYSGQVIGCKSACVAFGGDQYCCSGAHNTPETCRSSDWPQNYPAFFKRECPDAYSYAYDDNKSTFTCKAGAYNIAFGNV